MIRTVIADGHAMARGGLPRNDIRADFIAGMGKVNSKFVAILDIQRVLSVEEMATLATAGLGSSSETAVT